MALKTKPGLGRGLSALLDDIKAPDASAAQFIPISDIIANPMQPRRRFEEGALAELADSIRTKGVLQPILVRPIGGGKYELVAGERRWRASQLAQMHDIPAMVREMRDGEALQISIIENVQRADLNAIEEANSYHRLMEEFGHTQEQVGQIVGKSRQHVGNLLRLLQLPERVRDAVVDGRLSMGHARAIATAPDPIVLMNQAISGGLSVRQTEARAARVLPPVKYAAVPAAAPTGHTRNADVVALERQLSNALGLEVRIDSVGSRGSIEIGFDTLDQLDMLCQRLSGGRV